MDAARRIRNNSSRRMCAPPRRETTILPQPSLTAAQRASLSAVGAATGFATADARPLRLHDVAVFLLERDRVVVRLLTKNPVNGTRAATALQLTDWLAGQDFPAIRPAWPALVYTDGHIATIWRYLPQPDPRPRAPGATLGRVVRDLHRLPPPPFPVPAADPLARLRQAIDLDRDRPAPVLTRAQREFCRQRIGDLASAYAALGSPLGEGLIHSDAHLGNLLADPTGPHGYVLDDWDGACHGPRELDLIPAGAPGNRLGGDEHERRDFAAGYGYDIATWPPYTILRDIRELRSIGSHLRVAPEHPAAAEELRHRLHSLQTGDRSIRWHAVP